ncbi:MAG: histidine kinase [Bacteroidota bacterium]
MIAIGLGDSAAYSNRLGSKGYAYFQAGDDVKALKYLSKSIVLLKRNKDAIQTNATTQSKEEIYQSSLLNLYIDLLQLYSSRGEVDKAEAYIDSSQLLINQTPHRALEARFLAAVGRLRLNEGRAQSSYATAIDLIEESIQNFRESNKIYLSLGDPELAAENNPNIATAFQIWAGLLYQDPSPAQPDAYLSKLDSSFLYITEYLQISQSQNRMKGVSFGLRRLASYNVNMGKYELAKSQILQSLQAAGEIGASRDSAYAYWQLGELYETMGEYKAAIECYQEYDRLAATFRNQTSAKAMAFAEAKYKTDIISLEKEQIRTLAKQRFRNTLTIAGTGAVILLVFIGYFYMRNQQQRKLMSQQSKMNRQLVVDLIKEQAIESLNSKLEGQEKERKRIARELHDRLGGTLAAAKLSLEGLGRRLGSNHKEHYSHAQDLLQLAYQETRQLSHDMMALPLKHLGLEASFQALCDTINKSGKIEVNYDATFQTASFLSPEAEIHLYRILQELLQNVIKHARATQVFVQITQTLDSFTLLVEDNGRGFPKNAI